LGGFRLRGHPSVVWDTAWDGGWCDIEDAATAVCVVDSKQMGIQYLLVVVVVENAEARMGEG
jgi:hypothetical protein